MTPSYPVAILATGSDAWHYLHPHTCRSVQSARDEGDITTAQKKTPDGFVLLAWSVRSPVSA
jgi:hypothetical protein